MFAGRALAEAPLEDAPAQLAVHGEGDDEGQDVGQRGGEEVIAEAHAPLLEGAGFGTGELLRGLVGFDLRE